MSLGLQSSGFQLNARTKPESLDARLTRLATLTLPRFRVWELERLLALNPKPYRYVARHTQRHAGSLDDKPRNPQIIQNTWCACIYLRV